MSSSSSFYLALHFLYADEYELIMKLFRNFGKLAVIQSMIEAAFCDQFIMSTLFDNASIFHHKDQVCVTDGGETVSNDKACTAFHHSFKSFLNL